MRQGRITPRVLVSAYVTIAVILTVGATSFLRTLVAREDVAEFADVQFPATLLLTQITEGRVQVDRAVNAAFAMAGRASELRAELDADIDLTLTVFDEGLESFSGQDPSAEWKSAQAALEGWRASVGRLVEALRRRDQTGGQETAVAAWKDTRAASMAAEQALLAYRRVVATRIGAVKARSTASTRTTLVVIGAMALLGLVAAVANSWALLRILRRALEALVREAARLERAVDGGELDVRADAGAAPLEYAPLVEGMNKTVQAFVVPLRMTAGCIDRIARGDIPPRVEGEYQGEFAALVANLNRCTDAVNALVEDAGALAQAGAEGRLAVRADAARHAGDFRKVVDGMNRSLDGLLGPVEVTARAVAGIARGELPAEITAEFRGDLRGLRDNVNGCIAAVRALVRDVRSLAEAGVAGDLSVRADASRHLGDFRIIVEGMNWTLDAVVGPLGETAKAVARIAAGDIPEPSTAEYRGDFLRLRDDLNRCIEAVKALVRDANGLAAAAVEGRLETRADATRHQGEFRSIVDGMNRTMAAVVEPVGEAARVLESIANRDLRARMSGEYRGDHARIKRSVNGAAEALHDALAQVAQAVDQVSSAATQIATSSQAVASGASEQAASLVETTSSIESVGGMTRQAAGSAQQADAVAKAARTAARSGAQAVEQMQGAMARIRASSQSTSQIIRDMNDIAFQTNLLALNAAVEAARAGEAGRGFAVVADEVRSLALRSKEASHKTEELIHQSVREAEEGESTAAQVASQLSEIGGGVAKVTDLVAEIAMAAGAQEAGIEQVTRALDEMDKVTQQNAASAEESSSAASELSGQAEELAAMVASFQLQGGAQGGPRRGPGAVPAARARRRVLP